MQEIVQKAIGIGGYVIAESTLDSILSKMPIAGIPTDLLELGLGYYLSKKSGIVGSIGKTMFTINLYNVIKNIIGGGFNLLNIAPVQTEAW